MTKLFCAHCGLPLHHYLKAIKELGIIVDIVDVHVCADEPVPFDLSSTPGPFIPIEGKDKFVLGLNDLKFPKMQGVSKAVDIHKETAKAMFKGVGTDDLRDRRFEGAEPVKSSAPISVLDQIKSMTNSIPVHEPLEPESEE